jgi:hypothetical protein
MDRLSDLLIHPDDYWEVFKMMFDYILYVYGKRIVLDLQKVLEIVLEKKDVLAARVIALAIIAHETEVCHEFADTRTTEELDEFSNWVYNTASYELVRQNLCEDETATLLLKGFLLACTDRWICGIKYEET